MIAISQLLRPQRAAVVADVRSKKAALETLCHLIHQDQPTLDPCDLFERLVAREKLGSTDLGHGFALPHIRAPFIARPVGALLRLTPAIEFSAHSQSEHGVDLIFALLVPENADQQHLELLAMLAENFSSQELRQHLRQANNGDELYKALICHEQQAQLA